MLCSKSLRILLILDPLNKQSSTTKQLNPVAAHYLVAIILRRPLFSLLE